MPSASGSGNPARSAASSSLTRSPTASSSVGSGTVGTGCLLEIRDERLGRYLQPGDTVTLAIERLGALSAPIVERPAP